MRFACLLVEHLPTRAETLAEPTLAGTPIVVLRDWDGRVLDASTDAIAMGVAVGDTRQRIEQLCLPAGHPPNRERGALSVASGHAA